MKKILAIALLLFMTFMSYVLIGGFLQKQSKENSSESPNQNSSTSHTAPATTVIASYTPSDVAKHSTSKDCWLIINNNVYSVGSFMREHPGGAGTIIPYCGKEATKAFDTQDRGRGGGHSQQASQMLGDYLIGTIKSN